MAGEASTTTFERSVLLAGLVGLVLSLSAYVGLLGAWGGLPLHEAVWIFPFDSRASVIGGWAAIVLSSGVAWAVFRRGSPKKIGPAVGCILFVALCVIVAQEVGVRASVDGWPTFGDRVWREFVAPLYAEHALTLALAFAGVIAISSGAKSERREKFSPA